MRMKFHRQWGVLSMIYEQHSKQKKTLNCHNWTGRVTKSSGATAIRIGQRSDSGCRFSDGYEGWVPRMPEKFNIMFFYHDVCVLSSDVFLPLLIYVGAYRVCPGFKDSLWMCWFKALLTKILPVISSCLIGRFGLTCHLSVVVWVDSDPSGPKSRLRILVHSAAFSTSSVWSGLTLFFCHVWKAVFFPGHQCSASSSSFTLIA